MGCFNVSCGITRLSICAGDDCVLFPLAAPTPISRIRKMYDAKGEEEKFSGKDVIDVVCPPNVLINYTYDIWEPMTFPIRGIYNEYGSIEDIIHDENTEIIEAEYGMKIEDFVRLICDLRKNPYDIYSEFSVFYKYREDLDCCNDMSVFLEHIGFVKNKDNHYENNHCIITFPDDDSNDNEFNVIFKGYKETHNYQDYDYCRFLSDYHSITDEWIGIEEPEKMVELLSASGMFILGEVYDFYAKNHLDKDDNIVKKFPLSYTAFIQSGFKQKSKDNEEILVKDGYELDLNKKLFEHKKIYDMDDFIRVYKIITKESFDISRWNGMDSEDWCRMEFEGHGINQINNAIKLFSDKENEDIVIEDEDIRNIYFSTSGVSPFTFMVQYTVMRRIYTKPILMRKSLDALYEFRRLMTAINLTNVLLMPGICGTQGGCDEAEGKLVYIMKQVVDNRYDKQKNCGNQFKKITSKNALSGFNNRFY